MGVYIKGMEMPKNCNECKFGTWSILHQTAACKRHDFDPCFKDSSREYMEKRADFCPLVEVPEPHGRLIDVDNLMNNILYEAKEAIKKNDKDRAFWIGYAAEIIMKELPVIEGEDGENHA